MRTKVETQESITVKNAWDKRDVIIEGAFGWVIPSESERAGIEARLCLIAGNMSRAMEHAVKTFLRSRGMHEVYIEDGYLFDVHVVREEDVTGRPGAVVAVLGSKVEFRNVAYVRSNDHLSVPAWVAHDRLFKRRTEGEDVEEYPWREFLRLNEIASALAYWVFGNFARACGLKPIWSGISGALFEGDGWHLYQSEQWEELFPQYSLETLEMEVNDGLV